MKNLFILCMTQILFFSSSFAQGSNGLVAHWNFNGTAQDISSNGLHGQVNGPVPATGANGLANSALKFDGVDDYVTVPYNSIMNTSTHSICAYVKPLGYYSGICQDNVILFRGDQTTNGHYGLVYYDNAFDNSCNIFSPDNEVFAPSYNSNLANSDWYDPTYLVDTNEWYCVISTYSNDTIRLYVNGVLRKEYKDATNYNSSTTGLSIGKNEFNAVFPYYLNGVIDDIRLYNRALTSTEVLQYCDSVLRISNPQPRDSVNRDTLGGGRIPVSTQNIAFKDRFNISVTTNALRINSHLSGFDVVVYNSIGQTVGKYRNISNRLNIEWSSSYPPGIYVIQVRYKNEIFTQKLLK